MYIQDDLFSSELSDESAQRCLLVCTGVKEENIEEAVTWALEQRAEGRSVFVHCAHGHGRSLGVLCACLVMAGAFATYEEAVKAAQAVRPKCKLNRAQTNSLKAYLTRVKKLE